MPFVCLGFFGLSIAAQAQTAPAPGNDNLANATALQSTLSGSVTGSNEGATAQTGEPAPFPGNPAQSSIWYTWTAPVTGIMQFNTHGSTTATGGSTMATAMAIYTLKAGTALTFANLALLTDNQQDANTNSWPLASRVNFTAVANTTYVIQLDGSKQTTGTTNEQGTLVLNWSKALSGGVLGFTASYYAFGWLDDEFAFLEPANVEMSLENGYEYGIDPTTLAGEVGATGGGPIFGGGPVYQNPSGGQCKVTVTRTGSYNGRILVDLKLTNNFYQNTYTSNIWVTNILIQTVDPLTLQPVSPAMSTNIITTNVNAILDIEYDELGALDEDILMEFTQTIYSNVTPGISLVITTNLCGTNLVPFDFNGQDGPSYTTNTFASADGTTNLVEYLTNYSFVILTGTGRVPAAIDGVDYSSSDAQTLVFDDYQMSQVAYLTVNPGLTEAEPANGGPDGAVVTGINRSVLLTLANPRLDPLESLDVAPPTLVNAGGAGIPTSSLYPGSFPTADMNILDFFYPPGPNGCSNNNPLTVFNFERATFRCNKDYERLTSISNGVMIYDSTGSITFVVTRLNNVANQADTIDYAIDGITGPNSTFSMPTFLEAGSDNALGLLENATAAGQASNNWDFGLPYTPGPGTITFPGEPAGTITSVGITIPINNNGAVEFNEDFQIVISLQPSHPPNEALGNISTCNVTIDYDDTPGLQSPGGSADRTWNVDNLASSYPPFNSIPGANAPVDAVATQPDGKVVIGGQFDTYDGWSFGHVGRALSNGLPDTSFNPGGTGADNDVDTLAIDSSGRIIIGGQFLSYNGVLAYHLARLNPDGTLDSTFMANTGSGANATVWQAALDSKGNILISGDFVTFNSTNANHLARLLPNGSLDTTFNPGTGPDNSVRTLAVDSFNNVVIGGLFQYVDGVSLPGLARLLPTGSLDTNFNPGVDVRSGSQPGQVFSLAIQSPGNQIVIGGNFTQVNDITNLNNIAVVNFNGSVSSNFSPGAGANGPVYAVAFQPDGKLLLGGGFTSVGPVRRVGYARLFANGWVDTSFLDVSYNQFAGLINHYYNTEAVNTNDYPAEFNNPNYISALAVLPNSNVVIGGSFLRLGGGFTRDDTRVRFNVASVIGAPTVGPQDPIPNSYAQPLGNYPGNVYLTQPEYNVNDTAQKLFVTIVRTNGTLAPLNVVMGTNSNPFAVGAAGPNDYGLFLNGVTSYIDQAYLVLNTVYPDQYGWRDADAAWGPNNAELPYGGISALQLNIIDDKAAQQNLLANLTLAANGYDIFFLGGQNIPTLPAVGGNGTAVLQIINDNYPAGTLGFSLTNYSVTESAGFITVTVLRTNGNTGPVFVNYTTQNGYTNDPFVQSAIAGVDYTTTSSAISGPLEFANGVTSASFNVPIIDHSTLQSNKFFNVILSVPGGGASFDTNNPPILVTNAVVTIVDDHFTAGHLSFAAPTFPGTKGGLSSIVVERTGGGLGTVSAQFMTSDGTGTNGINYVGITNPITLTWGNSNVAPQTILITNLEDNIVEGTKTVNLILTNPMVAGQTLATNAYVLIYPSNAVLNIADDDSYGTLNFTATNINILQNAGLVLVTVSRTGGTVGQISVQVTTSNGTNAASPFQPAVAGTNYGTVTTNLTFNPGVTSQTFTVPIYLTANEATPANRIINLTLYNPSPSAITNGFPKTGTITILDPQLVTGSPGTVDYTLLSGTGFNDVVKSLSLQPDGKLLAGGNFTFFNEFPYNQIARLNADGSVDSGFLIDQAGADGLVQTILSQAPVTGQTVGSIMVVGNFAHIDTVPRNGIARLNPDGSLDETFNPGSGADSVVYTILQTFLPAPLTNQPPVSYYLIGGNFANYDGVAASGVARLTSAGLVDPSFNTGGGVTSTNGAVHALALQADGKVIVGGDFTSFNTLPYHHLVRLNLDGSVDKTFNADTGADLSGSVEAIAIQPNGQVIIGGVFTTVNGIPFNHVARLNSTNGSVDTTFNVGVGANATVLSLAVDSQGKILVGGQFTTASGVTRNGLTRLNSDGTVDPTINFGYGANGYVDSIAIQANDEINVAGSFSTFGGVAQNNFTRLFGGEITGEGTLNFTTGVFGALQSQTNAMITIQRFGGTGTTNVPVVSALFYTQDGTALSGIDYVGVTNTISMPLGEPFATVFIPIINTGVVGPDKFLNLNLANPVAATLGIQSNAVLIITNVNSAVSFSAPSYRVAENAPGGAATIPIVRTGNPYSTLTVTVYTGTNGTAQPGVNYIAISNTVVFQPGEMTNLVAIYLINNTNMLSDETVDLELTDATGGFLIAPSSATLTIATVYAGPGVVSFNQLSYSVSETNPFATITLLRTNGLSGPISVELSTSNGTAVAGVNYLATNETVFFSDSQSSATALIPIIQLTNASPDTTVYLLLSNPSNTTIVGSNPEVLTIQNNIENFTFGSADYFVGEGGGSVTLAIYRNGPTNGTVSVDYTTFSPTNASPTNGFAVPGVNYGPTNGVLTFLPGQTVQTIPVAIYQQTTVDGPLTFQVNLTNNSAGTQIGNPGSTEVTIIGDVTGFSYATNAYTVGENSGSLLVSVERLNVNTGNVSVNFATSDGTAVQGVDYVATNGTLAFQDGVATNTFTVLILNPSLIESNKFFNLLLSVPTNSTSTNGYLVAPSNSVVTITNVLTGVNFASSTFTAGERGVQAQITVALTGVTNYSSNNPVTIGFTTADGSGVAGKNYSATNGTLTFAPGVTSQTFAVPIIDDHIIDGNHTVNLSLFNPVGALLEQPSSALLTITEGDGSFIIAAGTALVSESIIPTNGIIDPGETVTIDFGLRCIAGGNTVNLISTLQTNSAVTPSTTVANAQSYGVVTQGGPVVFRPFTFTANGTNSQLINVQFLLTDQGSNLTTVVFNFVLGTTTTSFSNTTLITITNIGGLAQQPTAAIPYPSSIPVSGIPGNVGKVTVTLNDLTHSFPSDIEMVLSSPITNVLLMADVGRLGGQGVTNLNQTFDDAASNYMSTGVLIGNTSATNKPTPYYTVDNAGSFSTPFIGNNWPFLPVMPSPLPLAPYPTNLSVFSGTPANGVWSLYVADTTLEDYGMISNGWTINISSGNPVPSDSDLELAVTASPSTATLSNLLTYNITLTNYGPAIVTGVVITDVLPAGLTYLSNNFPGTVTVGGGVLSFAVTNSLGIGNGVAFNIAVLPNSAVTVTNSFAANANQLDPSTNNATNVISIVGTPSADLAVTVTGAPNPVQPGNSVIFTIVVTNNGPSAAAAVMVTNILPAGMVFTSASTNGNVTNAGGTNVWTTNLAANASATFQVVAEATAGSGLTVLDSVNVASAVFDPFKFNNFSSAKIVINPAPLVAITSGAGGITLTWPLAAANFALYGATNLSLSTNINWVKVTTPVPSIVGGQYTITVPLNTGLRYFILKAP